jgi:hypothetical protein
MLVTEQTGTQEPRSKKRGLDQDRLWRLNLFIDIFLSWIPGDVGWLEHRVGEPGFKDRLPEQTQ